MEIFNLQFATALGFTLIHSLWQATLMAVIMTCALNFVKKESAKKRYLISMVSLFLTFGASIYTFWLLYNPNLTTDALLLESNTNYTYENIILSNIETSWFDNFIIFVNNNLEWINSAWAIGMVFFLLRILIGLNFTKNLHRSSRPIQSLWLNELLITLKEKAAFNKLVGLRETIKLQSPSVAGWIKPCIYFPIGLINNISPSEAEAVLAHELAHIIRNDYIINILQSIIEAFFYFHPAIWWISANIRNERENACDDLAVQIIGDKIKYAKSLVYLQEWESQVGKGLALNLSNKKTPLFSRLTRILNKPKNRQEMKHKIFASLLLLSTIILFSASNSYDNVKEDINENIIIEDIEIIENDINQSLFDTIPPGKGASKSTIIELKNGKIQSLEINGEKIPESEFENHQNLVDDLKSENTFRSRGNSIMVLPYQEGLKIYRDGNLQELDNSGYDFKIYEIPERLEGIFDKIDHQRAMAYSWDNDGYNNFKYDYDIKMDTFRNRMDSFKLKMNDFHFDFPEMAHDIKIYLDSMNFPQMAYDVRSYIDSFDFKRFGNEFKIAMDSMHFDNIFKNIDSLRVKNFDHFYFNSNNNLQSTFIKELKKDKLQQEGTNSIELKYDQLKINGAVQSAQSLEKYKKLYEKTTGTKLLKGSSLNIEIEEDMNENQYNYRKI